VIRASIILCCVSSAWFGAGCHSSSKQPGTATTKPSEVVLSRQENLKFEQPRQMRQQHPVTAGTLPLVYMVETPATVRVKDATSGVAIGEVVASARALVSVDANGGVRIEGNTLTKGPLPADHVYEIYIAPPPGTEQNIYRTEHRMPGE
jgi:hypothetical protein